MSPCELYWKCSLFNSRFLDEEIHLRQDIDLTYFAYDHFSAYCAGGEL